MNLGTATVIRGDARRLPMADNTVDLIVTSPPYFALRSYRDGGEHYEGQIGSEPTPQEFLDALVTGTVAMVAKALGRDAITVDLSADYCRIADWRTNDRDQLARVLGIRKADDRTAAAVATHDSLLDLLGEETA